MINPALVLKILSERKIFIENHPDFVYFILETFKSCNTEGTVIELKIKRRNEEERIGRLQIEKSDEIILDDMRRLVEEITS